jgi:hypothetical protein
MSMHPFSKLLLRKRTDNTDKIAEVVTLQGFDVVSIATDKNPDRTFVMAI